MAVTIGANVTDTIWKLKTMRPVRLLATLKSISKLCPGARPFGIWPSPTVQLTGAFGVYV